jgi:hypothetical protein
MGNWPTEVRPQTVADEEAQMRVYLARQWRCGHPNMARGANEVSKDGGVVAGASTDMHYAFAVCRQRTVNEVRMQDGCPLLIRRSGRMPTRSSVYKWTYSMNDRRIGQGPGPRKSARCVTLNAVSRRASSTRAAARICLAKAARIMLSSPCRSVGPFRPMLPTRRAARGAEASK